MKYSGITIGPIGKTLGYAKKTREIWAASYFFSHLMKQLLAGLAPSHRVILPNVQDPSIFKDPQKAGIFPDRCILEGDINGFPALLDRVYQSIAQQLHQDMLAHVPMTDIEGFLRGYLHVRSCTVEVANGANPVDEVNKRLDVLDASPGFFQKPHPFWEGIFKKVNGSFLIQDAFGASSGKKRFDSIPEIATRQLSGVDLHSYKQAVELLQNDEEEGGFYEALGRSFPNDLKAYHRYFAVVQADADNMGNTIAHVSRSEGDKGLDKVSGQLLAFAKGALPIIEGYGGSPVYLGGDDLLFFAPIVGPKGQHIFELVQQLDRAFSAQFANWGQAAPTMSFGVAISYYKYPMSEALNDAQHLLFNVAKKSKNEKNAVAFQLRKHSGQAMQVRFDKSTQFYRAFLELMDAYSELNPQIGLLSSVIYKLQSLKPLLDVIGAGKPAHLANFFKNNFNEADHRSFANATYLAKVERLVAEAYNTAPQHQDDGQKGPVNAVYAALRLVKFLNTKPDDGGWI